MDPNKRPDDSKLVHVGLRSRLGTGAFSLPFDILCLAIVCFVAPILPKRYIAATTTPRLRIDRAGQKKAIMECAHNLF